VGEDPIVINATKPAAHPVRTLFRWAVGTAALVLLLIVLALLDNNYSLTRLSRGEFRARLDRSVETATSWLSAHPEMLGNPASLFMVADMQKMSSDARLRRLLDDYRSSFTPDPRDPLRAVWAHIVDPRIPVPVIDATGIPAGDVVEILWMAYAVAPDRVLVSEDQRANMFSRTRYFWGRRNHQLFTLDIYRHYNGGSPALDSTLAHLATKVARDARFDLRVNDSYPQRIAFVLAAGHPELIRPRWVERVLSYQHRDGHWSYCWYRWCKGIFEFSAGDPDPAHTTVQAAWALHMLKHRFPRWIDQHYQ